MMSAHSSPDEATGFAQGATEKLHVPSERAPDPADRKRIEDELRASEERFRTLVEHSTDGIFIADAHGRYLDVNPSGCAMLGYTREEILARTIADIVAPEHVPRLSAEIERLLDGSTVRSEWLFRRKGGSTFHGEVSARRLPDSRLLAVLRDISERKRVEHELRTRQQFIEAVAKASPPSIYVFDLDQLRLTYLNRPFSDQLGPPEVLASIDRLEEFKAFVPHEEMAHLDRVLREWRSLRDGDIRDDEYCLQGPDGATRWFHGREIVFTRYPDGTVHEVLGTLHDITERRESEAQLRESQTLFRRLVETSPMPMLVITADVQNRLLMMNERFTETFGYSVREVPDIRAWWPRAYPDPEYRARVQRAWSDAVTAADRTGLSAITPVGARVTCLDGSVRDVEVHMGRSGSYALVVFNDVTEQKHVEQRLRESEARYRLIVENQNESIVKWLPDGTRTFVNDSYCRTFGVKEEECIGTSFLPLVAPEHREEIGRLIAALSPQAPQYTEEHVALVPGSQRWQQWTTRGIFDAEGRLIEMLSTGRDITERKRAEEKLQQSQIHLLTSQHIARVGSWEMELASVEDFRKNPLYWSDECFRVYGYRPGAFEVTAEAFFRRVHPDDRDKIRDAAYAAVSSRSPLAIDHRTVLDDGSERLIHVEAELVLDPAGLPTKFIGTAQDITDRVRLEEQLRQSQKMQAIGQLAGGVAHDFNNLLTVINGHSEMLLSMHPADAIREELLTIRDAGERAALLTRQLLLFSRKAVLDPRELDCNAVVRRTSQMLRHLIGEDVRLTTVLSPTLYRIKADPSQIEQVIMNLSLNARDAMPRGGRLTIETRNAVFTDDDCMNDPDIKPGQFVDLRVIDTGSGMTPQVRAHLFEPFFTTKGPGKGTGLGLATVYGIVQESEGFITVTSELDVGTTFNVFFPALKSDLTTAPAASADRRRLHGHETILLVEDEEGVRQIARTTMENYGYTVLVASSGPEALRLMESRNEPVDLLLTDVVMPGMSGQQLAAALLERCPECKVIFMSGYNKDNVSLNKATQAFLQKPFTLQMLARRLRDLLDQP